MEAACASSLATDPHDPRGDKMLMSPRQQVRKLVVEDRLHPQEIIMRMQGVLSKNTVKQYIKEDHAELRKKGIVLGPIRAHPDEYRIHHPHNHANQSVSQVHVRIGAQINRFRTHKHLDAPTFSKIIGFSNQLSLRSMELGTHDFTLSELQRLAIILGLEVSALLEPVRQF